MDKKRIILTTLRQCLRRLQALERAHCDNGTAPVPDFACLMPLIDEAATSSGSSSAGGRSCRYAVRGTAAEPESR